MSGSRDRGGSAQTVLALMCVGYFLVLLDVTIVNVALPAIGNGLRADVGSLQWVVDGYALALASLMLPCGTLGDLHGHRRVVLAGLTAFGAGSLACGLAPNAGALTAARAVQGVGAALLLPGTLAIITRAFPQDAERARAIGVWAGIGSLALPAGPLAGGALVDAFGWRAVFLVNVPIVAAAIPATLRLVRADDGEAAEGAGGEAGENATDSAAAGGAGQRRMDVPGAVLGVLLLVAVTSAFIQGGRSGAGSPGTLAAACAAVVLLGVFCVVERRRGDEAMLPLALLRRRDFSVANAAAGVMNLGTLGALFVLTLFLQTVQHRSPLGAGVAMIPLFAPLALLAPLGGRLTARIGPRLPATFGLVLAAVGLALLGSAERSSHYAAPLLPAFLAWGIGLGVLTPALVAAAVSAVPRERAGLASAVNNTARQAGGAIGIAVAGAIAGQPGSPDFLRGLHIVALGAAALYLLTALTVLLTIRAPGGQAASDGGDGAGSGG